MCVGRQEAWCEDQWQAYEKEIKKKKSFVVTQVNLSYIRFT